ncbi:MAG TPA: hypothetical protein VN922_10525, partial [Bacteroidia bacterium]|nr:hypothetical protein [Bacteroidia bacterium]
DGLIIDWYGSGNANSNVGDATANQTNTAAMIADVGNYGLKYALAVEDASMSNPSANLSYAATNYFPSANYIKLGDMRGGAAPNANAPLALDFEPFSWANPAVWNNMGNTKALLTYYGQSWQTIPSVAGGEFMWPWPQGGQGIVNGVQAWYNDLNTYYNGSFYTGGAPNIHNNYNSNGTGIYNNVVLGVAFPGFFDFYRGDAANFTDPNAGCCDQYGIIPRNYNGNTLSSTLNLAKANQGVIDGIQIATWNDYSEGTEVEPTVEYGFQSLVTIQQFTGVPYVEKDLRYIDTLYMLRKQYSGNSAVQTELNTASCDFASLQNTTAESILRCIVSTNGGTGCANPSPSITSSLSASDSAGFAFN